MIRELVVGLGLVAVVEGLAVSLAPSRLRSALEALDRLGPERARLVGLLAVAIGVALVWIGRP